MWRFAPRGFRSFKMAMPLWLREKLFQKGGCWGTNSKSFRQDFEGTRAAVLPSII